MRGKSKQDYSTPWEFIRAVEKRFGDLNVDLAASDDNAKAPYYVTEETDSLSIDWSPPDRINMWLNPPFANIEPWVKKCAATALGHGSQILVLVPASIGSNWFAEHVHGRARVYGLSPRLTFEGCKDPYPKDLMLCVYGERPGLECWRWK